uniref:Envelope protein n=1 Tax=Pseudonaja textilis TaxID=8673 RepID=A0A670Y321_PSETE
MGSKGLKGPPSLPVLQNVLNVCLYTLNFLNLTGTPPLSAASRHFTKPPVPISRPLVYYRQLPDPAWKGPVELITWELSGFLQGVSAHITAHNQRSHHPKKMTTLFFFLLGCSLRWTDGTSTSLNAHKPHNITWVIKDAYGQVLNSTHNYAKIDTYFPHLQFDFAEMIVGKTAYTKTGFETPQPSPSIVKNLHLYVCPGHDTSPDHQYTCGGLSDYFCKSWSCVSTGHIWWSPPYKNDLITLSRSKGDRSCAGPGTVRCNMVTVKFTARGKASTLWDTGVKWGGRVYDTVGYDSGNIFYIQRQVHIPSSDPVGPSAKEIKSSFLQPLPTTTNPLLPLLRSSYSVLNASNTFISKHCWLCLSPTPPFYEAVGSSQAIRNDTSDSQCRWHDSTTITITSIIGQGCCLGHIPENYSQFCNISKCLQGQYFIPGDASVWACSMGLTACASGDTLIKQNSFCIQVQLLPKIDVYNSEDFVSLLEPRQYNFRAKREVVTALTLAVLLGLGASGTATGIAGLVTSDQHFRYLSATIDADLRRIEQSIVALQNSLTSLSEVVLQNRRGLDLLFLKQGGLCAALKEECCFYADSSGVVLDSMKELDTRLKESDGWTMECCHVILRKRKLYGETRIIWEK